MGSHNGLALRVTQNNSNTIPLSHNIHERVLVVVVKLQILCKREHSKYEALQEHTKCYIENTSNACYNENTPNMGANSKVEF